MILNTEQQLFIDSPMEDSKLIGIPGGGKTTTIINKIIKLFTTKQLITKGEFLVTTFSKKASTDFVSKGNLIYNDYNKKQTLFSKDNVKTFHSLSGSIIQTLLGRSCNSLKIAIISAINILKTKTIEELKKIKCLQNLKIMFVDEAQDISDIQYELIILIKTKLQINLVLVGDPNQTIYQFQNGSDKYLLEYEAKEYFLKVNNRSTPEITNFINQFRPWDYKTPEMIASRPSTKTAKSRPIIYSGSQDEICEKICKEILQSNILRENIAIIGPVKKSDNKDNGDSIKFGLQKITNLFSKRKIKFVKHYNDNCNEDEYVNLEIPQQKDHVNIYTIHGSKGLEFDKVIIVNFHSKTFGKIPSVEEYNELKYLWYVAISRAKTELLICCDRGKKCWNELRKCPKNLYLTSGDDLIISEPKFSNKNLCNMSIQEIVSDKKIFNENVLLKFYSDINFTELKESIYKVDMLYDDILDQNYYLVNYFLKITFEYYYCLFNCIKNKYIEEILNFLTNVVYVDKKYSNVYESFREKCGLDLMSTTNLKHLLSVKILFNKHERKLLKHIIKKVRDPNISFSLAFENDDIYMNPKEISKICDNISEKNSSYERHWEIFKLCLFRYQYESEAKYLWTNKEKFSTIPKILSVHIEKIRDFALGLENHYKFRKKCLHPNLKTNGTIDMLTNENIITILKFSDQIEITDKIKAFLYYHTYCNKWNRDKIVQIINFKTGIKHILYFEPIRSNLLMSAGIAHLCKVKLYNMIFLYDLEATDKDHKTCEITERYIYEITHDEKYSEGILKIKSKLSKFVQELTGITQTDVNNGEPISKFYNEMSNMLEICFKPTFIAHNGNAFDHPLMRRYNLLNNTCNFLDSRLIIGQLSKEKTSNETLSNIYEIIIGHKYEGKAHRAKADVIMLLDIFKKLNIKEKDLLKFI